jgi:tetratricopeptide (TPR) repeat protein
MSVKVASNRFIVSSKYAALYQQLLSNVSGFQELGNRLVQEAELAQGFRQQDKLKELAITLSNFPSEEFKLIGQYYLGWCAYRSGKDVQEVFEEVLEKSKTYKAKALMTLAALEARKGNHESELDYFIKSLRFSNDIDTTIKIFRGIAIVKSKEGYHKHALKDLEMIVPYFKYVQSHVYYDCLNSLAVEFGEVGRIEEAGNISQIILASPFAFAYPEWRETGQDLALRGYKSRSSARIKTLPGNLLYLPEREASDAPVRSRLLGSAPVVDYQKWKEKKMVKEPNGDEENIEEMDVKDLFLKLVQISTQDGITRKKLYQIVKYALKVTSED